jgi:hypothetical protein
LRVQHVEIADKPGRVSVHGDLFRLSGVGNVIRL